MLAETFLNKRFQAGKAEGIKIGLEIGRAEGFAAGLAEVRAEAIAAGRAQSRAELLKFLNEHPEVTVEQFKDFLQNGPVV